MSYYQSTKGEFILPKGVDKENIIRAFAPFAESLYWPMDEVLAGNYKTDTSEFTITHQLSGDHVVRIRVDEEVGDRYMDRLKDLTQALSTYVKPERFKVINFDCPQPEEAVTVIWVGQGSELVQAMRAKALTDVVDLLMPVFDDDEIRGAVQNLRGKAKEGVVKRVLADVDQDRQEREYASPRAAHRA